jgi:hypothetical protein
MENTNLDRLEPSKPIDCRCFQLPPDSVICNRLGGMETEIPFSTADKNKLVE